MLGGCGVGVREGLCGERGCDGGGRGDPHDPSGEVVEKFLILSDFLYIFSGNAHDPVGGGGKVCA